MNGAGLSGEGLIRGGATSESQSQSTDKPQAEENTLTTPPCVQSGQHILDTFQQGPHQQQPNRTSNRDNAQAVRRPRQVSVGADASQMTSPVFALDKDFTFCTLRSRTADEAAV